MGNNQSDQTKQPRRVDGKQHQSVRYRQQEQQLQQQVKSQEYEDYGEGTSVDVVTQKEDGSKPTTEVMSGLPVTDVMSGLPATDVMSGLQATDVMSGLPGEKGKPAKDPPPTEDLKTDHEIQKRNTDDHDIHEKSLADRVNEDVGERKTDKQNQSAFSSSQYLGTNDTLDCNEPRRLSSNRTKSQQISDKTGKLKSSSYRPRSQKSQNGTDRKTSMISPGSAVKESCLKLNIPKLESSVVTAGRTASKDDPVIDISQLPSIQTKVSALDPSGTFKRRLTFDIDDNRIKYLPEEHNLDNTASRQPGLYTNVVFFPDKSKGASPKRFGPKRLGTARSKLMDNIEESDSDSFEYQLNTPVQVDHPNVESHFEAEDHCSQHSSIICDSKECIPPEGTAHKEQAKENFNFVDDHFALETGSIACGVSAEFGVNMDEAGAGGTVQHIESGSTVDANRSLTDAQTCDNAHSDVKENPTKPEDIPMVERNKNPAQVHSKTENKNTDKVSEPVDNTTDQGFFCSDGSSEESVSEAIQSNERNCLSLQDGLYDTGQSSDTESENSSSDSQNVCSSAVNPNLGISRFCERHCLEVDYSRFESRQGQFVHNLKSSKTDIAIDNRFTLAFNFPCCRGLKTAEVTDKHDDVCMNIDEDFMNVQSSVNFGDSIRTVGSIESHEFIMNDFDSCSDDDESGSEKYIVEDLKATDSAKKSYETQELVNDTGENSLTGMPYVEDASGATNVDDMKDKDNVKISIETEDIVDDECRNSHMEIHVENSCDENAVVDADGKNNDENSQKVSVAIGRCSTALHGEIEETSLEMQTMVDNGNNKDLNEIEKMNDHGSDAVLVNGDNDKEDDGNENDVNDKKFDIEDVSSSVLDTMPNMLNMGDETGSHLQNKAGPVSEHVSIETETISNIQTCDNDALGETSRECDDTAKGSCKNQSLHHNISEEGTAVATEAVDEMEKSDNTNEIKGVPENGEARIEVQDTEQALGKIKTLEMEDCDNSEEVGTTSQANIDMTDQDCALSSADTEATCEGQESEQTPEIQGGNSSSELPNMTIKESPLSKEACKSLENEKEVDSTDNFETIGNVQVRKEMVENLGKVLRRKETAVLADNRIWAHFNRAEMEEVQDDVNVGETNKQASGLNTNQTALNADSDSKKSEKAKSGQKLEERGHSKESDQRKDSERTRSGVLDRLRKKKDPPPSSQQRNEHLLFPFGRSLIDPFSGLDLSLPPDEFLHRLTMHRERAMGSMFNEHRRRRCDVNKNESREQKPDTASHDDNTSEGRKSSVASRRGWKTVMEQEGIPVKGIETFMSRLCDDDDDVMIIREGSTRRERKIQAVRKRQKYRYRLSSASSVASSGSSELAYNMAQMFGGGDDSDQEQSDKEEEEQVEDEAEKPSVTGMMIENDIWRQAIDEETNKCFKNPPGSESRRLTVLVVDISGSMQGEPWQQLHTAITEFIQGLEEVREKHKVEEYVAMVIFGHETKMAVTPTSDYREILHTFERLTAEGMSPMLPGFLMALFPAYDESHGRFCHFHLDTHIRSRVVLLTDGHPTPQALLAEKDWTTQDDRTIGVEEFVEGIKDLPIKNMIHITCVPIGSGVNMDLLQKVVTTHKGKFVTSTEMRQLARSTYNHYLAAPILKQMFSVKRDKLDVHMFRSLVLMLYPDLQPTDISEMVEFAEVEHSRLHAGKTGTTTWISGSSDVDSDYTLHWEEDVHLERDKLPPLGTRVARGPDMKVEIITGADNGTVTGHSSKNAGKLFVHWDSGQKMKCRYGHDSCYDVVLDDTPLKCRIEDPVKIGCKVRRGPDWCYGDQDGGSDHLGAVYDVSPGGVVFVRWPNGCHGNYRHNMNNKYDVLISDPGDPYGTMMFTADMNKRNITKTRHDIGASPYRNHRLNIDLSKSMFGLGIPSPTETNLSCTPLKA